MARGEVSRRSWRCGAPWALAIAASGPCFGGCSASEDAEPHPAIDGGGDAPSGSAHDDAGGEETGSSSGAGSSSGGGSGTAQDASAAHDAGSPGDASVDRDGAVAPVVDASAEARADADAAARDAGAGPEAGTEAGPPDASSVVIAATPPLGWNSWNTFQCNISETLIRATADAMASSGMQAAGFQYVNIDDCWMNGRDANGNLQWDPTKFPSGIPALATYVHGKGLKLGIYETPNTVTCVGIYGGISPAVAVGSLGHEAEDARTFASWGVDYLKYDLCQGQLASFAVMRDALRASGRAIVYSINPGNGTGCPPTGAATSACGLNLPTTANLWRIAFDINASWTSIASLIDADAPLSPYAGPGHWNDPDMLEVGNGTLTQAENESHLSMWAMLAAPMLAGNDLRSMSAATQTILTNAEIVALDQDPLGAQATLAATPQAGLQVWSKPLSGGNVRAVALLNRNATAASISVSFTQVGLTGGQATVRDLWQHADLGAFSGSYTAANVPSHGVVVLRIAQ